jgi:hypothetical protein
MKGCHFLVPKSWHQKVAGIAGLDYTADRKSTLHLLETSSYSS